MFPTIAAETKLCKKFNIQEDCQSTSAGHHISAALFGQTTSCALFAQATTLPRPMCSSTQLNWKREKNSITSYKSKWKVVLVSSVHGF